MGRNGGWSKWGVWRQELSQIMWDGGLVRFVTGGTPVPQ